MITSLTLRIRSERGDSSPTKRGMKDKVEAVDPGDFISLHKGLALRFTVIKMFPMFEVYLKYVGKVFGNNLLRELLSKLEVRNWPQTLRLT